MIRKLILFCLLLLAAAVARPSVAQTEPAPNLDTFALLSIEVWPDHDRPESLVIVSGLIPLDTPFPSTVRYPFPAEATLNAVAFSDGQQQLFNITDYVIDGGELVFTTPSPSIRIEYYVPYSAVGDDRAIEFSFNSPFNIQQFEVTIKEPDFAESFVLIDMIEIIETTTGSRFHLLESQPLTAGESFQASATYSLPGGRLSVTDQGSGRPESTGIWSNLAGNWGLTTVGVLMLGVALFFGVQVLRDRSSQQRPPKPSRNRTIRCANCNSVNQPKDKFCRNCGQPL